ncbi:MAG: RNA polymerase sigma factor [Anaerolineales bacterium]|nr:RNA polymerase sigma factor [Anaerolineales bacterium]MCA9929838.1 RNA polymerase sigma factor [Anaerolineales bacterium]
MKVMSTVIPASSPPRMMQLEDEQLVQQTRQTPSQFAHLYDRHVTSVYRYLLAKVGNIQDAEDLTSQTFLEAFENLHRYRGTGDFRAWLFRIARNKSIDHYRKHRRVVSLLEDDDFVDADMTSPDTAAEQSLALASVMQHLRTLSPDRAEVVSLRLFAELEVKEIAGTLNKPETAVRMLLHRGIRDLQNRIAPATQEKTQ